MDLNNFLLFAFASLMLNITPGNDMMYVASRSMGQGIKAGIVSALGITAGCMVHIAAAFVGLSAIIAKSAIAFDIIKYLGAAYLVFLGIKSILKKSSNIFKGTDEIKKESYWLIFRQGAVTNILNPKVALFFLAFFPQFINLKSGHPQNQILLLGTWFNFSGLVVNAAVAILFGKLGNWLSKSPTFIKWQEKITGLVLLALGIKVAISSRN
ncbi:MAG: LysE family translocator [Bacteroidetes bacterium]|nr:MAG: LysE family translocator [Bacteroidota bacterium]